MGCFILMGALAAFGLICALWTAAGWLLPGSRGGAVILLCRPGLKEAPAVRRYGWLRDLGLLREPILLVDCGLTEEEKQHLSRLGRCVEFCSLETMGSRLEVERNRLD